MSIQDEGDGKHALLIMAGQSDAQELTLVEGTKNAYILEATGDKYIVMPDGQIIRVPHQSVASASNSATSAPSAAQSGKATTASASTNPPPSAAKPAPASPTAAAQPGSAMSIQDEGDGKHSLLLIPGQSDAQELTLASGTKNVYVQQTTGDKYIVMADGKIVRVPHQPATASK